MQLTFITGKGGVGKSAVTAALATVLSEAGLKVGVIELGETRMADFFRAKKGLAFFNLKAKDCFEEYAERILPKPALLFIKNRWVEHFIHAVPGLNEILLLGKITSLSEEGGFDHLLIDAPATGHTVSLCDAPRIALATLRHGPLKTTVNKIWETLHDPSKTSFLLVTQMEESIVEESVSLYQHIKGPLSLHWRGMVINGMLNLGENIPDLSKEKYPEGAEGLVQILKNAKIKEGRQQILLKEIKKEIPIDTGIVQWEGMQNEEPKLRQGLAKEIEPWALKNFSIRKN